MAAAGCPELLFWKEQKNKEEDEKQNSVCIILNTGVWERMVGCGERVMYLSVRGSGELGGGIGPMMFRVVLYQF